jgi:hypothetical protein
MEKIITSFLDFIKESRVFEQEKNDTPTKESPGKSAESKWDFNFDSGKFRKEDISKEGLASIEDDFKKSILSILNNPQLSGQKTSINLVSSTSKVPLGPNAKTMLKETGYSDLTNKGLATARLDTLENIIEDLLFKYLGDKDSNRDKFIKELGDKVRITKTPKADQGPDYSSGDDKNSEKYKEHQKISSKMDVTSTKIEDDRIVKCGQKTNGNGGKGTPQNYFAGYDKRVIIQAGLNNIMNIAFDPYTVPDSFFYKYGDEYMLSVFAGEYGPITLMPFDQTKFDQRKARAEAGEAIMPAKRNIKGKDYIVFDYKRALNEIYNKDNALVKAINERIKKSGIKGDIKSLQPKFFDANGKIEVYSKTSIDKMISGTDKDQLLKTTLEALKSKAIPEPPKCDPLEMEFTIDKKYTMDSFELVVFSPCAGTAFSLSATCQAPNV